MSSSLAGYKSHEKGSNRENHSHALGALRFEVAGLWEQAFTQPAMLPGSKFTEKFFTILPEESINTCSMSHVVTQLGMREASISEV